MNNTIVLVILLVILKTNAQIDTCDRSITSDNFKITMPKPIPMDFTRSTYEARLITTPETVIATIGFRALWRARCFEALFSNRECMTFTDGYAPDKAELIEWKRKSACATGADIDRIIDSNGAMFNERVTKFDHWYPNKKIVRRWEYTRETSWTLGREWGCGETSSSFFINIEIKPEYHYTDKIRNLDNVINVNVRGPNGTNWKGGIGVQRHHYMSKTDSILIDAIPITEVTDNTVTVVCFKSRTGKENCVVKCKCEHNGLIFDGHKEIWQCIRTTCIFITETKKRSKREASDEKSASEKDLKQTINEISFDEEETAYNILNLAVQVEQIEETITKMVISLSKLDDHLIGRILNQQSASVWTSPNSFKLYPCMDHEEENTNCRQGFIYKEGRWIDNNYSPGTCYNAGKIKNISLFRNDQIELPEVKHRDPRGTVGEESGWSWLQTQRETLTKLTYLESNGGIGGSNSKLLQDLSPSFLTNAFGWFTGVSNLVSYIALIIAVLAFCRR